MKKIRYLFQKANTSSEQLLNVLRTKGALIGKDVVVYDTKNVIIDRTAPWLLTIGDHVRITSGVKILTHDYSWSVLKRSTGNVLGGQSPVTIGNNVFIGMNAIITRGVTIGDNVIIGAGSVVTKDCSANGVYAGNPAKQIMSLDEFYEKRQARQFEEAKTIVQQYKARFGVEPPKEVLAEYFMLFTNAEEAQNNPAFRQKMGHMENYNDTMAYMEQNRPMFAEYEAFLKACF